MDIARMYALRNLQADVNERIEHMQQIEAVATKVTPSYGSGGGSGISDKVGKNAADLADLRAEVEALNDACVKELIFLQRYVNSIDDVLTRRIISLRFVEVKQLTWNEIARAVGGNNTGENVRQIACRYLRAN